MLAHERGDFGELLRGHDREVVPVVGVRVPLGEPEDLGEDRRVRPRLVEVVAAGPEVREHRRDTADERRRGLAPGVLRVGPVDAQMEVRVDRAGQDELPARIDHRVGARAIEIADRDDDAVARRDVHEHRPDVRQHGGPAAHEEVIPFGRHGAWNSGAGLSIS